MRVSVLTIALLVMSSRSSGQQIEKLFPEVGWDSLYRSITYPELALRAGLEGQVWANMCIDSSGAVDSITTSWKGSEIFVKPVLKALQSVHWRGMDRCNAWRLVRVYFVLKDSAILRNVYIESQRPLIDISICH
jgi:hypothetical protein